MASEITEEYLEAVYDLTLEGGTARTNEIAERMRVSPASVTEMVQRLSVEGFLSYERYKGARLTKKGKVDAPAGWLRYLVKVGLVELTTPEA